MMKYIIIILLFFISYSAAGQGQWNNQAVNTKVNRLKTDSVLIAPRDTAVTNIALNPLTGFPVGDSGRIAYFAGKFWGHKGALGWREIGEGSTGINIYNSDGTLTGDRNVTGANHDLIFLGLKTALFNTKTFWINQAGPGGTALDYQIDAAGLLTGPPSINMQLVANGNITMQLLDTQKIVTGVNARNLFINKNRLYFTNNSSNTTPWLDSDPDSTRLLTGNLYLKTITAGNPATDSVLVLDPATKRIRQSGAYYGRITTVRQANDSLFFGRPPDSIILKVPGYKTLFPKTGNLYGFGDSQTAGGNSHGPPYSDGTFLFPQYRWLNMLSVTDDRALTVNNFAQGSTKLSWIDDFVLLQSEFNKLGNLDRDWSGITVAMNNWNNLPDTATDWFFNIIQKANEAWIAKTLLDDYAGISVNGWASDHGSNPVNGAFGWVTNGVDNSQSGLTQGIRNIFPFYYGETSTTRYRTQLSNGQTAKFTLANKQAIALFYETSTTGNFFDVYVNGDRVATGDNIYTGNQGSFPGVVWIENPPANAEVMIQSATGSGTIMFLAFGWVNKNSTILKNKKVIYGSTSGNTLNTSNNIQYKAGKAAERAAGTFSDYPVYFANAFNQWYQPTDSDPLDPAHLTPVANQHVAKGFNSAYKTHGESSVSMARFPKTIPSLQAVTDVNSQTNRPVNVKALGTQDTTTASGKAHWALYNTASGLSALRWAWTLATLETGSNVGSDIQLNRYSDAGSLLGTALSVKRSTGIFDFTFTPTVGGIALAPGSGSANYIGTLNGLTGNVQTFAIGSSGTTPNISSVGTTHTFNFPVAGSGITSGTVTNGTQTLVGTKRFNDPVGFGTDPLYQVHISTNSTNALAVQNTATLASNTGAFLRLYGTGVPSAAGQRLAGILTGINSSGSTFRNTAFINFWSEAAWTDNVSQPTYITFETNASGANITAERARITAAGFVGINQIAPTSTLDVSGSFSQGTIAVTTNTTLSASHSTVRGNTTSGNIVLTLPTAASSFANGSGRIYHIKKISNDANTVSITPAGSEQIDLGGAGTPKVISVFNATITIQSNGTGWDIL